MGETFKDVCHGAARLLGKLRILLSGESESSSPVVAALSPRFPCLGAGYVGGSCSPRWRAGSRESRVRARRSRSAAGTGGLLREI